MGLIVEEFGLDIKEFYLGFELSTKGWKPRTKSLDSMFKSHWWFSMSTKYFILLSITVRFKLSAPDSEQKQTTIQGCTW